MIDLPATEPGAVAGMTIARETVVDLLVGIGCVVEGEHDLRAAYRALNTRQQGALLEVARGMAGQAARRRR